MVSTRSIKEWVAYTNPFTRNPPAGSYLTFFKASDGGFYKRDSAGNETLVNNPAGVATGALLPFFKGKNTSATAYAANTNIAFATRTDSHNAWNTSGNYWVIPTTGRYRITAVNKQGAGNIQCPPVVRRNATTIVSGYDPPAQAYNGEVSVSVHDLVAGDQIAVQYYRAFTTQDDAGADNNYFIIEWVPTSETGGLADSGWLTLTVSGFVSSSGYQTAIQYHKVGTKVEPRGLYKAGSAIGAGATIATFPLGYRPLTQTARMVGTFNGAGSPQIQTWVDVKTDGSVVVQSALPVGYYLTFDDLWFYTN